MVADDFTKAVPRVTFEQHLPQYMGLKSLNRWNASLLVATQGHNCMRPDITNLRLVATRYSTTKTQQ
eukprot:1368288-Rhodomonas_salina.1